MKTNHLTNKTLLVAVCLLTTVITTAVATADNVYNCNGVFSNEPCDQIGNNLQPGVSTVPSRDVSVQPEVIINNNTEVQQAAPAQAPTEVQVNEGDDGFDNDMADDGVDAGFAGDDQEVEGAQLTPGEVHRMRENSQLAEPIENPAAPAEPERQFAEQPFRRRR